MKYLLIWRSLGWSSGIWPSQWSIFGRRTLFRAHENYRSISVEPKEGLFIYLFIFYFEDINLLDKSKFISRKWMKDRDCFLYVLLLGIFWGISSRILTSHLLLQWQSFLHQDSWPRTILLKCGQSMLLPKYENEYEPFPGRDTSSIQFDSWNIRVWKRIHLCSCWRLGCTLGILYRSNRFVGWWACWRTVWIYQLCHRRTQVDRVDVVTMLKPWLQLGVDWTWPMGVRYPNSTQIVCYRYRLKPVEIHRGTISTHKLLIYVHPVWISW